MPVDPISEAMQVLAPHYGLKAEAFGAWAEAYKESLARACDRGYFVVRREAMPGPCQLRLAAGGVVGKLMLMTRNPDLGEDDLSTFFRQVGAVYSAHLVHAVACKNVHESLKFKGLESRVAGYCQMKQRTETTRVKKVWPNAEGKVMPIVDQALRAMAYTVGTEMGVALHLHELASGRTDGLARYSAMRPMQAPEYLREIAKQIEKRFDSAEPPESWRTAILKPITRMFKPRV
ncbi:MAG: hypothetical protein K8T20_19975 [Planctomycetes bacterium]|nr:hypothetical protein [Planctomycetota bacterium]